VVMLGGLVGDTQGRANEAKARSVFGWGEMPALRRCYPRAEDALANWSAHHSLPAMHGLRLAWEDN
jgi:hypothetical protein